MVKTYWVIEEFLDKKYPCEKDLRLAKNLNRKLIEVLKKEELKQFLSEKIDEFEEQLIDNLGWTKPEHHLLRGQLGIKFSIFKEELMGEK